MPMPPLATKRIMNFNKMKQGDETSNIFITIYKSVLRGEGKKWAHSKQFYETKQVGLCYGLRIGREGKISSQDNSGAQVRQLGEHWCQLPKEKGGKLAGKQKLSVGSLPLGMFLKRLSETFQQVRYIIFRLESGLCRKTVYKSQALSNRDIGTDQMEEGEWERCKVKEIPEMSPRNSVMET